MIVKNTINHNFFFLLVLLFSANTLLANLRAPWAISRYPSYSLSYTNSNLIVLKENLEIKCDKVYEGEGDFSKITEKKCKVEAVYFIQSNSEASYAMEFILPSEKIVSFSVNDSKSEKINPKSITLSDLEKEGYRLSDLCKFCDQTINRLYTAPFNVNLKTGINTVRIEYEQPLSTTETGYGYFQSSKWMNGFEYELWPLKEWKLDPKFEMNIKFTTEAGSAWNRLFSKKLIAGCRGIELRFEKFPGTPFKKQLGANGMDDYYKYNQNLNPNYNLSELSKIYYENDRLIYELNLKKKFPDRLNCYFGHERN